MEITEVRVKLVPPGRSRDRDRLLAFGTITIDGAFVVRDLKIIRGEEGIFVAMPSRKCKRGCASCGQRIAVTARYCEHCGHPSGARSARGRIHRDIAHPINAAARSRIHALVIEEYERERVRSLAAGHRVEDGASEVDASGNGAETAVGEG